MKSVKGGINVVLKMVVRRLLKYEQQRRQGGLDIAHVHSHTGDYGNDRADSLANLGKGSGPYSRQLTIKLRLYDKPTLHEEDDYDRDARIQSGEGYPHPAVPGIYCCVWATDEQVQMTSVAVRNSLPSTHRRKGYKRLQLPDFGSDVPGFGARSRR